WDRARLSHGNFSDPVRHCVGIPKCQWKRPSHQKLLGQWKEEPASSSKAPGPV
ncbi:hypothetical protein AVEN_222923-2-1, partial [Araneus ventricosus]